MTVVSNTSPLCYLAWIDHLGILPSMMSELDIQIEDYGSRWQISLLLDGKAVTVENKAGRVVIDKVGDGTAIRAADVAPTAPKKWGQGKVARAVATVAF